MVRQDYKTSARSIISDILIQSGQPLTIAEIYHGIKKPQLAPNLSTIYRNLEHFIKRGEVKRISLYGGYNARYEWAARHHHHFSCQQCHRLYELDDCDMSSVMNTVTKKGHKVLTHELTVYGICQKCTRN